MKDDVKRCVDALRICNLPENVQLVAFFVCRDCLAYEPDVACRINLTAADLLESLAAELEKATREIDGLRREISSYQGEVHAISSACDAARRERDAAVKDLHMWACFSCKHAGYKDSEICASCVYNRIRIAKGYISGKNRYEWRGVKED